MSFDQENTRLSVRDELERSRNRKLWWERFVGEEVFPRFEPMSYERALEISNLTSRSLRRRPERSSINFAEQRQKFINEVLPTLKSDNPRRFVWEAVREIETINDRLFAQVSDESRSDIRDKQWLQEHLQRYHGLTSVFHSLSKKVDEFEISLSPFSYPLSDIHHVLSHLERVKIKMRYQKETGLEFGEILTTWDEVDDRIQSEFPEWIRWLDESVIYEVSQRGIIWIGSSIQGRVIDAVAEYGFDDEKFSFLLDEDSPNSTKTLLDGRALSSVVKNLVMNIRDHSGIETHEVDILCWLGIGEDEKWRLVVANSGVGFAPHLLEDFEPNKQWAFRTGETTKEDGNGGLGLGNLFTWVVHDMGGRAFAGNADDPFSDGKIAYVAMEVPLITKV